MRCDGLVDNAAEKRCDPLGCGVDEGMAGGGGFGGGGRTLDKDGNPTDPVAPVLNVTLSRE